MTIEEILRYSEDAPINFTGRSSNTFLEALSLFKAAAVRSKDQELAKLLWCYEQILIIQDQYIEAFNMLKNHDFYKAWCRLERVEIGVQSLNRHFLGRADRFHIPLIQKLTDQWQSLYPYRLFVSPAFLKKKVVCSICKKNVLLRHPCGHEVGEIYDGEMCYRIVTEAEVIEISLVPDPVQKYSVCFFKDIETADKKDGYEYRVLVYLIRCLVSPFDPWTFQWTKIRHPHSRYRHLDKDSPCPCESGKKYSDCCLPESGVLRPHCQFSFSRTPPNCMDEIEYID